MERSVLIVDDDPSIRALVALALDFDGYATRTAANGVEALGEVEREVPDLVVLDMHLPIMDGRALARILRERRPPITLLAISGAADGPDWAEDVGADAYLGKPFSVEQLLAAVKRLCAVAV
jgi:DNA-binding response OmpR family regulator